jgi:hypothetical protein
MKAVIQDLVDGRDDIKALEVNLEGKSRLRAGQHRIVYHRHAGRIEVFYAAPRSAVYEFLAAHLHKLLG